MLLSLSKPAKVACQRFELGAHPLLFHFDLLRLLANSNTASRIVGGWWQEPRNIFQHRIARDIKRNVRRHQPRKAEQFTCRFGLSLGERVRGPSEVLWASPGRTEKDDVDLASTPARRCASRARRRFRLGIRGRYHPGGGERAKVGEHKLDLCCNAVQRGIMAREGETRGGCIERDD